MNLKTTILNKCLLLILFAVGISSLAMGQRTIRGTVTDAQTGDPLIGANILIVGTSAGTVTDLDGSYSLQLTPDATAIEVSYTGYATKTQNIGASNVMDFSLSAGAILDEVVVVGYGTVRRSDLTGSVTSVKAEDFNRGIVTSPDQLIQGKVAGVQIFNNSGQPGGSSTVRIRGNSSVRTGNQPLYVIDGVPLDGRTARPDINAPELGASPTTNPLNFINPADIASIEVLKDASATAIYGSRGSNGVIIVTTHKGRSGAPQINFNLSAGTSSILKKLDVLDGNQYRDALKAYGLDPSGKDFGGNVDAMDAVTRTGITQNYNVSIGGGSKDGNYRVSLGYLDQEGIIDESGLKKYSASLNGNYKFLDGRLGLDVNVLTSQTNEQIAPISENAGFTGDLIGQALQWNPTKPLRKTNGDLDILLGSTTINPLAMLLAYDDDTELTSVLASISPSFKITDNLEYRFLYSINRGVGIRKSQIASWINIQGVEGRGWANYSNNQLSTQQFTHTLSYVAPLTSTIDLNAVVGYEYQKYDRSGVGFSARDFITDDIPYNNIFQNSSQGSRGVGSFQEPSSELQSFFGRANFNISDKYLVTATLRADGSSKFGENNRYGIFPSFAAAWNLMKEDFLADAPFDNLKVRVGWGQTGNQEFPAGSAQERYAFGNNGTFQGLENVANPDLKWETSSTINAGIDFALFDFKLFGSLDFFRKTTTDLLFNFETIQPAPAGRYWVNLDGEVLNQGLEFALNTFILNTDKLSWNVGVNAAFMKNELSGYEGPTILTGGLHGQGISAATVQRLANGQPLNSFYTRKWNGIGTDGFDDLTDKGNTFYYLGDPNPNVLLGISTGLSAGKLDISLNFNGAFGHQLYNNTANSVLPIGNLGSRNIASSLLDSKVQEKIANSIKPSSRYMESGDYLKLTNMTVSYDLGNVSKAKNAKVFVTGQNLFILTKFTGFDPEVNTDKQIDGVPSFGIEYTPYPTARSIIFGVNFSF